MSKSSQLVLSCFLPKLCSSYKLPLMYFNLLLYLLSSLHTFILVSSLHSFTVWFFFYCDQYDIFGIIISSFQCCRHTIVIRNSRYPLHIRKLSHSLVKTTIILRYRSYISIYLNISSSYATTSPIKNNTNSENRAIYYCEHKSIRNDIKRIRFQAALK